MLEITGFVESSAIYVASFLLNYWLHSSFFLLMTLAALKFKWISADARGEKLLKLTLLLGLVSAFMIHIRPVSVMPIWYLASETNGNEPVVVQVPGNGAVQNRSITPANITEAIQAEKSAVSSPGEVSQQEWNLSDLRSSANLAILSLWLVLYWLVGVILMSVARTYQHYQLGQLMKNKRPLQDVMLLSGLASLKTAAKYSGEVRLYSSDILNSPIVLNQKDIVLPEVFVTRYSSAQQQAALAHELAHLKRKDMLWQKVFMLFDVVFFFQPLNRLLRKKLHQVVEQRADVAASDWTGNPRALAEALSVTAEQQLGSRHSRWVLAMKCEKSDLLVRVESLLKGKGKQTKGLVMSAMLLSVVALSLVTPGISLDASATTTDLKSGIHQSVKNDASEPGNHLWYYANIDEEGGPFNMTLSSINNDTSWKLSADMKEIPGFNHQETAITYFPTDSELEVKIDDGKDKRKLTVSRDQGEVEYTYYVNRNRTNIEDDPRWLARFIPELLRRTGWHARQRITRMLEQGGVDSVLDEVRLIVGDEARSRYLVLLTQVQQLSAEDIDQVITISSTIHSDYSKAKVLGSILQSPGFAERNYRNLIANLSDLESDVEMARVMRTALMSAPMDPNIWHDLLMVTENIQSDHELSKLLSELVRQRTLTEQALSKLLDVANSIESDYELSQLLSVVAENAPLDSNSVMAYLDTSLAIQSDYEMRRALTNLIGKEVENNDLLRVIDVAKEQIQSDNELANLFLEIIRTKSYSSRVRDELFDALDSIQSDSERLRVLRALKA